jgi:uncharacterized lipoprotein YbaY
MTTTTSLICLAILLSSCNAWSHWKVAAVLSALSSDEAVMKSSFPIPSLERPRIVMPSGVAASENQPVVQGLVYLINPQALRPDPSEYLILEVRDATDPSQVLAGAKLSVAKIRFPMKFVMYDKNILPGQQVQENHDLLLHARICPSVTPCEKSSLEAEGIAKSISKLPGMAPGTYFRAGASLGLKEGE